MNRIGGVMSASVIIPARNEETSLRVMLPILCAGTSRVGEILIIVDFESDSTFMINEWIENLSIPTKIIVSQSSGIAGAIETGILHSKFEIILTFVADEILPILIIDKMIESIESGSQFVGATRYSRGGKRYGGSVLGKLFSRASNRVLKILTHGVLSDSTSGMKAFHKKNWDVLGHGISFTGWAPILAITLNAYRGKLNISEVPVISVDRIVGGHSNFRILKWIKAYLKVFINKLLINF